MLAFIYRHWLFELWRVTFRSILKVVTYFTDSSLITSFQTGVAIGNGYLDVTLLGNSLFHFYYTHGMLGMADYLHLIAECCPHTTDYTHCDIRNSKVPACNAARAHAMLKAETPGINPYNIYDICASMPHKVRGSDRKEESTNSTDYFNPTRAMKPILTSIPSPMMPLAGR